jgi:putative NIF3 family GTP cyclohydrolase 1 type 2
MFLFGNQRREAKILQPADYPPAMDTESLMQQALEMAGLKEVPADSQVYVPGENLQKVLVAIDVGPGELLLAKQLGFDGVIAHHPAGGAATLNFHRVLTRHQEMMEAHGVPPEVAHQAVEELAGPRRVSSHAANYDRVPSFARLLGMPFMNIHLPWDEIGRQRMVEAIQACGPDSTVRDAVRTLRRLPEFQRAETDIEVRLGREENRLGRWVVVHGAGTNGGYPVARAYYTHGVDTVVYIHISPVDLKRLRDDKQLEGKNLVITGHAASDSLGINPYVARLRQDGLEVTCMGGVVEV